METKFFVKTDDGTPTLFLEEYDQSMHSSSGAYEESLLKHIIPSEVLELEYENIFVLDIGFGLGYNILALIKEFNEKNKPNKLFIISLEKEKNFTPFLNQICFDDSRDTIYEFIKETYISGEGVLGNINLKIIFGDARDSLKTLQEKFNVVFQDPFSPGKNPELWSLHYFQMLRNLLTDNGIITTYSSALQIRRAMIDAGLFIGRGPSVGKKREGTIASLKKTNTELTVDEKKEIVNNIKSEPYQDPFLNYTREKIIENRLMNMRVKKLNNIV